MASFNLVSKLFNLTLIIIFNKEMKQMIKFLELDQTI